MPTPSQNEQPVSTEQDSVQRLAEARQRLASRALGFEVRADADCLNEAIDSLTAERADLLLDMRATVIGKVEAELRAEAAEAEVKRLREALTAQVMWVNGNTDPLKAHTYDCSHKDLDPGDCTYLCMKIRAALAPPSEGGTA